jgi:hypothetical protein
MLIGLPYALPRRSPDLALDQGVLHSLRRMVGRKRYFLADTEGLVLEARVHSAKVPDQDGIRRVLEGLRTVYPRGWANRACT